MSLLGTPKFGRTSKFWWSAGPGLTAVAACLLVAGCGEKLSRTIGLSRDAPDEFTVTTRAPLSMPPDFDVRPPRPGASRPQETALSTQAEAALVPQTALAETASSGSSASPGEQALDAQAGPVAPADIRRRVDADAAIEARSTSFTDELMFWKTPPKPGVVVDPQKEQQRIQENAALGQNQNIGDTPIIQNQKSGGLFSNLF